MYRLEKNIVEAVYCAGVKYGTGKDWVFLFNKSLHSIPAEQSVVWQALICSRETWILKGYLFRLDIIVDINPLNVKA